MCSVISQVPEIGSDFSQHSGRYKAGFHTAVFPKKDHRRQEAYVINDTPDAFWVEYGHSGREPYHTMHRALLEAGE